MLTSVYLTVLALHSGWRWVVLLSAITAVVVSLAGWRGRWPFKPAGQATSAFYIAALDAQFLLGLGLYATSPLVRSAWMNLAGAMKAHELRFFALEHLTSMLLALALAHVGSLRAKRAQRDASKYLTQMAWHAASLAMVLIGMPWWRPLFRPLLKG